MTKKEQVTRRAFLSGIAIAGTAGALGTGNLFTSCRREGNKAGLKPLKPETEWNIPDNLPDKAIDGVPLKVGLIGCGRRGAGAINDLFKAASGISVVALGDVFQDKIDEVRKLLKDKLGQSIPAEKCFTGFDNYEKVIHAGIDMVILATPPAFRPRHFKAAVEAGKHAFLENQLQ